MTFAKTFAAVFLAIIAAAGVILFLRQVVVANNARAETRQLLFKSAIDRETHNWAFNHQKEDPDGTIYQGRINAIKKAREAGDGFPPKLPDSYATLNHDILLDNITIVPAGTGLEFVAFQQNGTVEVRYSGRDLRIPAGVVDVR